MNKMVSKNIIMVVIIMQILIRGGYSQFESDEDSGSIELPNRPENRQAHKAQFTKPNSDPQTFLHLLSKLMNTIKLSIDNAREKIDETIGYNIKGQKSKRNMKGLHKAYAYAEKAKRHFFRHLTRN